MLYQRLLSIIFISPYLVFALEAVAQWKTQLHAEETTQAAWVLFQ